MSLQSSLLSTAAFVSILSIKDGFMSVALRKDLSGQTRKQVFMHVWDSLVQSNAMFQTPFNMKAMI